jgi:predicted RNase H-like nuclease (RuvC/YqgF family)
MPINEKGTVYFVREDREKQCARARKHLVKLTMQWARLKNHIEWLAHEIERMKQDGRNVFLLECRQGNLIAGKKELDMIERRLRNYTSRLALLERDLNV